MTKISVLILTKNEEKTITDCLDSLRQLADEVIIVDDYSEDGTINKLPLQGKQAPSSKVKVYQRHLSQDFAAQRNFALSQATGDWVLFIDADERVTPELVSAIKDKTANKTEFSAFRIKRKNYYFGSHLWPHIEEMARLFRRNSLKSWQGKLHESSVVVGKVGILEGFLLHYTHQNLSSMLNNTMAWSGIEADLRFKAGHPKITWWRFPRVMLTEFLKYYLGEGGWKLGTAGLIESLYQSFSIFITYARLWEKQNVNRDL